MQPLSPSLPLCSNCCLCLIGQLTHQPPDGSLLAIVSVTHAHAHTTTNSHHYFVFRLLVLRAVVPFLSGVLADLIIRRKSIPVPPHGGFRRVCFAWFHLTARYRRSPGCDTGLSTANAPLSLSDSDEFSDRVCSQRDTVFPGRRGK